MAHPILLPPEWHPQSAIQLTWPHIGTDWEYMIEEVTACYVNIATEILKRQKLIIVCYNAESVKFELREHKELFGNLTLVELPTNDTWARDHSGISVIKDGKKYVYDFTFNGWGLKFASNFDNQITRGLFSKKIFASDVELINKKDFVLEGGAIESDGKGTLLTTSECLLSPNRNSYLSKESIEEYLKEAFGLNRVLWLDHGYFAGDDTDSHIDTLARFCDEHTIAYVKCEDTSDEHYDALAKMEEQLKTFTDYLGNPYKLVTLPMAKPAYDEDNQRLPATYANFLIMNNAVLLPFYNDKERDEEARKQLQKAFPAREIIGGGLLAADKAAWLLTLYYNAVPREFYLNTIQMKDQKALLFRCIKNDVPAMVFSGNDILFLPLLKRYYEDAKKGGCTQEFLDDIQLRIEEFEKHIEMSPDTIKLPD